MERKAQNNRGGSKSRAGATPKKATASNKSNSRSSSTAKPARQNSSTRSALNRNLSPEDDHQLEISRKNVKGPASGGRTQSNNGGARSSSSRSSGRTSR